MIVGEAPGGGIEVAAGEGSVIVMRAQFEGGREDTARAVLAREEITALTKAPDQEKS